MCEVASGEIEGADPKQMSKEANHQSEDLKENLNLSIDENQRQYYSSHLQFGEENCFDPEFNVTNNLSNRVGCAVINKEALLKMFVSPEFLKILLSQETLVGWQVTVKRNSAEW